VITADNPVFPNNIVELVSTRAELLDDDLGIFKRPLRNTDPNQCVGVFAQMWTPEEDSHEFLGVEFHDPTIERYTCTVQGLIKNMDQELGLAVHSVLSEMLRTMLYRDTPLRVGLQSLSTELNGVKKRVQRWGVSSQRYFSNEIQGNWLYLSTLEFWLETERF
jgi:hypothetical protein